MTAAQSKSGKSLKKSRGRPDSVATRGSHVSLPAPRHKYAAYLVGLLVVAGVALYFPVISHPFANYDDSDYVVRNQHIKDGLTADSFAWAFTSFDQANWHPLTWISHALDVSAFGVTPGGPHGVNLGLHALNVVLLFWVLKRATGFTWRSLMVAALFALHPINVESVAWIAERKNLLSMTFFLLALGAYRWYAQGARGTTPMRAKTAQVGDTGFVGRYVVVAVLFAMGLMAKPQVITLPFVLLLWDYWPLRRMRLDGEASGVEEEEFAARSFWWLVREKIPLFAIAATSAVITMVAQRSGGAVLSLARSPLSVRMENAIVAYARYVGNAFWPAQLAPLYPYPTAALHAWQVAAALLFLAVVSTLVVVARRRPYLLAGWLWFLGTLVPMIGVIQVGSQAMADRYAYLPFIGLFLMVVWGVAEFAAERHVPVAATAGVSVAVLVALMVVSYRQINYWSDNTTLWAHTLQVTGPNYIVEDNLAESLSEKGRTDEAMQHFHNAIAIYDDDPTSNMQIAMYEHQRGNFAAAVVLYQKMTGIMQHGNAERRAEIFADMGHAYRSLGDVAGARRSFDAALALDARSYRGWIGAGLVAQKSGDLAAAIRDYSQAVKVHPSDVGYLLLAAALQQNGSNDEAQAATQHARFMSPNLDEAQRTVDGLLGH